jgi:cell wall-associated NlpC family hydrolase
MISYFISIFFRLKHSALIGWAAPAHRVGFHRRPIGGSSFRALGALGLLTLLLAACGGRPAAPPVEPPAAPPPAKLALLGYTIQVGAFAQVENAARLATKLQWAGLDAYYFIDEDKLYKVRFGDFASKEAARRQAESLKANGTIQVYYIVAPEQYSAAQRQRLGDAYLRDQIVQTARGFIGVPYLWGGASVDDGFDCSGLTMTSYRLNGLNLPRTSRQQYAVGTPVPPARLAKGDLVFFATRRPNTVSHVGIYIGNDRFIHAPKQGQTVRVEDMSTALYKKTFAGARTYL